MINVTQRNPFNLSTGQRFAFGRIDAKGPFRLDAARLVGALIDQGREPRAAAEEIRAQHRYMFGSKAWLEDFQQRGLA